MGKNGINIPESYKDWLRFSKSATIRGTAATFYEPKDFITDNVLLSANLEVGE